MNWDPIDEGDEVLTHRVIGAAIKVHRLPGPGFLESIYNKAIKYNDPTGS